MVRTVLFRFDAEQAHHLAAHGLRWASICGGGMVRLMSGAPAKHELSGAREVFGLRFANPVGLAAGFDKNAESLRAWPALGFGFCEIGTVTPRPQPGNERPRMFRAPERHALFNRMGFNNAGAEAAARRLGEARPGLPAEFRVGANVGKNKDTPNERAHEDYRAACRPFEGLIDYLVVNVSSPNTPGLRALQSVEALRPIVQETLSEVAGWRKSVPVLLKLAPEVESEALEALLPAAEAWGIGGWVLTNTLAGAWSGPKGDWTGGWSGAPVRAASFASLVRARALTRLPVISVGGIDSPEEARRRFEAGASLVQLYSGFVFGGPTLPSRIVRSL